MMRPKSVIKNEALHTEEEKIARDAAHSALHDKNIPDDQANEIIKKYNALPHAIEVCTREQYRGAYGKNSI